tara:strand:+ start:5317 stop:6369 length:1053 start_codon:yes stop_codon:yes gene_type:complete
MLDKRKNENFFFKFLDEKKIQYKKKFELKQKSWIKAGGIFELYILPKSLLEIKETLSFLKLNNTKFYTVGNLSNIIFRDGTIKTPIINIKKYDEINVEESKEDTIRINVYCGVSIFKFVNFVSRNLKISGVEGLVGIPGSLGGAIYMNASSYDSCISEFLKEVKYVNEFCEIITLKKKDLKMNWRSSIFHEMSNFIIINAIFEFPKKNIKNSEFINSKIEKTRNHRAKFQEKKFPNLGSLFATKDLYKDISNFNFIYRLLYLFNKIMTKIILKFLNERSLLYFRKILVTFYSFSFNINNKDSFILSDRTINCLINNGSNSADDAIKTIKKIQKKIGYSQKLENILIEEIE